jgi:YidC/Oxa1 family membrane protein insertase
MNIIFHVLNQLMTSLFSIVGDWGIVIILATITIRICLLPISWKQKKSMNEQQKLSKKIEDIKERYKNDQEKQKEEITKLSSESAKSMLGCLVTLLQLPIMYGLYGAFSKMPIDVGSVLVPWMNNLKLPDTYCIIPVLAALVQLLPSIFMLFESVKSSKKNGLTIVQMILMGGLSMLFLVKAPVTIGIYWITSGLFSVLEQAAYNKMLKKVC